MLTEMFREWRASRCIMLKSFGFSIQTAFIKVNSRNRTFCAEMSVRLRILRQIKYADRK